MFSFTNKERRNRKLEEEKNFVGKIKYNLKKKNNQRNVYPKY